MRFARASGSSKVNARTGIAKLGLFLSRLFLCKISLKLHLGFSGGMNYHRCVQLHNFAMLPCPQLGMAYPSQILRNIFIPEHNGSGIGHKSALTLSRGPVKAPSKG